MAKSGIIFCLVALLLVTASSCQEMEVEEEVPLNDEGLVTDDPLMEDDPAGTLMPFLALKGEITVVSTTGFAPQMMHYVVGNALRVSFFIQRHVDVNLADSNSPGSYELTVSPGKRDTTHFDNAGAKVESEGSIVFTIPQGSFRLPEANLVLGGARRTMNSIQFEFFATEDALESSEGVEVSSDEQEGVVDGTDEPLDNENDGLEMLDGDTVSEGEEAALEEESEASDEEEGLTDVTGETIDDSQIEEEQIDEEGEEAPLPESGDDEEVDGSALQFPTDDEPPADLGEEGEGEVPEGYESGDQAEEAPEEGAEGEEWEPADDVEANDEGYPPFEEGEGEEEEPRDEL